MHSDTSPDFDGSASDAARRSGMAIVVTAAIVLAGACLLNCPGRFSELHEKDTSLLRPIVSALGLFGEYGTQRGVEVRNLVFYAGAAGLSIIAGLSLALGSVRSRYSIDDLLDGRSRAASPVFWWLILLVVSALSSIFSHAPAFCQGQMIVRLLLFSWWWPIATILSPRQTRALAVAFVTALAVTAALGLAYHFLRIWPHQPQARLQYPLGNELWMKRNGSESPEPVARDQVTRLLQAHFRPEFLNRIDEIVVFHNLTRQDLAAIVEIQLRHVSALLAERGYQLEVSPAARAYLAEAGYDPDFGARPLKRLIQREVQDPLAMHILSGDFPEGAHIRVDRGEQGLSFAAAPVGEVSVP